jgi:hypothetical protein
MTSPNGTDWTGRTNTSTKALNAICWSPELRLFYAAGPSHMIISSNGIDWTGQSTSGGSFSTCWSPELGVFCSVGSNTALVTPTYK